MAAPGQPARTIRFDAFEVDLQAGLLRKHGFRIRLQEQPFAVLALMLERPGEAITREEFRHSLWPSDTFVDFDHGLNNAINRLREALNDSADSPRFIETLPRRGYRFIAHVENGDLPAPVPIEKPLGTVPAVRPKPELSNKRRIFMATGAAVFLIVAALVVWRFFFARRVLTDADVILLASFVNNTGDPIFNNSLDKPLEIKLTESPFLSIFPEAGVRETLRTMRRDPNDRVTREVGIEICKRQGIKAVVVPEIDALGSK